MNKQEETSLKLFAALALVAPAFFLGAGISIWRGYWAAKTLAEMRSVYGWRTFSIVECSVAMMLLSLASSRSFNKGDTDWSAYWVNVLIMPMATWLAAVFLVWCAP